MLIGTRLLALPPHRRVASELHHETRPGISLFHQDPYSGRDCRIVHRCAVRGCDGNVVVRPELHFRCGCGRFLLQAASPCNRSTPAACGEMFCRNFWYTRCALGDSPRTYPGNCTLTVVHNFCSRRGWTGRLVPSGISKHPRKPAGRILWHRCQPDVHNLGNTHARRWEHREPREMQLSFARFHDWSCRPRGPVIVSATWLVSYFTAPAKTSLEALTIWGWLRDGATRRDLLQYWRTEHENSWAQEKS